MGNKKHEKPKPLAGDFLDKLPTEKRLASDFYSAADCEDAIHGRRIPKNFGRRVLQLCVIRGIRHYYGFAQDMERLMPELTPVLDAKSSHEVVLEFIRALNARHIMSGVIPALSSPEETPYCIWHPDVPSKDTLRALVKKYPQMIYNAARACAIGGYLDLYKELDPLPEVHVAEEAGYAAAGGARDSQGSQGIYEYILSQPVKFSIMNDYTRRIDIRGHRIAPLNGDTAVYSSLEARWAYHHHKPWNGKFHHFNITEDFCIDDHDHEAPQKTPDDYFPLLYSPLPADLPLIDKDKLFYVAAYTGDIDRYVRLKRPQTLPHERSIVIHGIYHNVFFAKWWSTQVAETPKSGAEISIRRAINARRIMSNDLSWMAADTPENLLPENIWYPSFARPSTYESLAHLQPKMFTRCLRACIAAGYDHTWDQLLLEPPEGVQSFKSSGHPSDRDSLKLWRISRIVDANIWEEANSVPQKKFLQEICAAVPDILNDPPYGTDGDWASSYTASDLHRSSSPDIFIHDPVQPTSGIGPYDGLEGDIGDIGLAVFVRDNLEIEAWEREQEKRGSSESFLLLQEIRDVLATIRSS